MSRFATSRIRIAAPLAVCIGALLSGCGTTLFSGRGTNPVIQDFSFRWWSDASTLSTTASRRLALMAYKKGDDGKETLLTCAEPPPDVGETFAKALAAQIEASGSKGPVTANVGAGYAEQVATAIAPLVVRSQGLQVLRDSAYNLCIDYMNGWIPDSRTYLELKDRRFDRAVRLIETELPQLHAVTAEMAKAMVSRLDAPTLPPAASAPLPVRRAASQPSP